MRKYAMIALAIAFFTGVLLDARAAQPSPDLFKTVAGVANAKLTFDRPDAPGKLQGASRKSSDLRYVDQRIESLDAAFESNRVAAEKLANQRDASGAPLLIFAIYAGDGPIVVDLLLSRGADPNARANDAPALWHALALANEHSTQLALALLDYGADPNGTTASGEPALHRAAATGAYWAVQRLLERGADRKAVFKGKTAEQVATTPEVRDLLKNWGSKPYPYSPRRANEPALHRAASQNNVAAVKRLLASGADPNALWNGKKAVDLTTSSEVRAALGGKGKVKIEFPAVREEHVFRGEYVKGNRHKSGGHSYAAYLYMKDANLKPKTHGRYENGVQVCSVERRVDSRKADDPANPQHTFFPESWSKGDVIAAINSIALSGGSKAQSGDSTRLEDDVDGVRISAILRSTRDGAEIVTAYPLYVRQPRVSGKGYERLADAFEAVDE